MLSARDAANQAWLGSASLRVSHSSSIWVLLLLSLSSIFSCFVNSNLQCLHILFCVVIIINLRGSGWISRYCIHLSMNKSQVQQIEPREKLKVYQILGLPGLPWYQINRKVNLHSTVALSCYLRYIHQCKTEGKDSVAPLPHTVRISEHDAAHLECHQSSCTSITPPDLSTHLVQDTDSQWKCTEHSSGRLWGRNHGSSPQGWRWESPQEWWMLS